MATVNRVTAYIDRVKPNVYTDEDKFNWISTLEGLVAREVMGEEGPEYEFPKDVDTELMVPSPFDDIYQLYVGAMIDFHNLEYDQYNNTAAMFEERLEQFKAWYIRNNPSCNRVNFKNVN